MTIFLILHQPSDVEISRLQHAIDSNYRDTNYRLSDNAWLVASDKTAKHVSDTLSITDGKNGSAIIVGVSDYFGRAKTGIWAWIKANWEGKS